jgi:hypothetical protein
MASVKKEIEANDSQQPRMDAAVIAAMKSQGQPVVEQVDPDTFEASSRAAQEILNGQAKPEKGYRLDETVPGGQYVENGLVVNGLGTPIVPKKLPAKPEEPEADDKTPVE